MAKSNRQIGKEISEVECVKRFLTEYNRASNVSFSVIEKNLIQNSEVDVFVKDIMSGLVIKIQIVSADDKQAGDIGKNHRHSRGGVNSNILCNWVYSINKKQEKYKSQGKNTDDIILLLDEMGDPPDILFKSSERIYCHNFKEIWLVRRHQRAIKLCKTYSLDELIYL